MLSFKTQKGEVQAENVSAWQKCHKMSWNQSPKYVTAVHLQTVSVSVNGILAQGDR